MCDRVKCFQVGHGDSSACLSFCPRSSVQATFIELGPQNHDKDGLLGPHSIMVVYMDLSGWQSPKSCKPQPAVRSDSRQAFKVQSRNGLGFIGFRGFGFRVSGFRV